MAHRFMLVGYLSTTIGAWVLVKNRGGRAGFVWFAIGATLQLVGGLLQHFGVTGYSDRSATKHSRLSTECSVLGRGCFATGRHAAPSRR